MVRDAIMPEEQVSSDDAANWFRDDKDQATVWSTSCLLGRVDQLDRAIVVLKEMEGLEVGILFKQSEAIISVDEGWDRDKNYKMVPREVENALNIICSEKLLRK